MTSNKSHQTFLLQAIQLAKQGMQAGQGGPFGAVIVKNGQVIAQGQNSVTSVCDPTAHAEVVAIRNACAALKHFQLDGCVLYSSCEPCPMCLGAIYWARPDAVYYAATRADAAAIGFDDQFIYQQIALAPEQRRIPFFHCPHQDAIDVFQLWHQKGDKIGY